MTAKLRTVKALPEIQFDTELSVVHYPVHGGSTMNAAAARSPLHAKYARPVIKDKMHSIIYRNPVL